MKWSAGAGQQEQQTLHDRCPGGGLLPTRSTHPEPAQCARWGARARGHACGMVLHAAPQAPSHLPLRGVELRERALHLGVPVGIVACTVSGRWHGRVQLDGNACDWLKGKGRGASHGRELLGARACGLARPGPRHAGMCKAVSSPARPGCMAPSPRSRMQGLHDSRTQLGELLGYG